MHMNSSGGTSVTLVFMEYLTFKVAHFMYVWQISRYSCSKSISTEVHGRVILSLMYPGFESQLRKILFLSRRRIAQSKEKMKTNCFRLFRQFLFNENFKLQKVANSDRWNLRRVHWPLDLHNHGPKTCIYNCYESSKCFYFSVTGLEQAFVNNYSQRYLSYLLI